LKFNFKEKTRPVSDLSKALEETLLREDNRIRDQNMQTTPVATETC
jgi:hypothetical protein